MLSPSAAVQAAVNTALRANAELRAVWGGWPLVQDDFSNDGEYPFIVIGEDDENVTDLDHLSHTQLTLTIRAYSNAPGKSEIKAIQSGIRSTFYDVKCLDVEGFQIVSGGVESARIIPFSDGSTVNQGMTIVLLNLFKTN